MTTPHSPFRSRRWSRALGWGLAGLLSGCAVADAPPAPALSLRFAALDGGCQKTTNGSNTVPEGVDKLVLVLKAEGAEPRTVRASRADVVKAGAFLVKGIPVTDRLDVEVYGCDSSNAVQFAGQSNGTKINSQQESTIRAFLLPVNKVACTGDSGLPSGAAEQRKQQVPEAATGLPKAAALASAAALPSGNVVLTGGIGEWDVASHKGIATRETARYDHRTGHFSRGPLLRTPRVWHHTVAVSDTHVLVVGGVGRVEAFASSSGVATPAFAPGDITASLPLERAELIDVRLDAQGQNKPSAKSTADVGVGANLFSSALRVKDEVLFVGGVSTKGSAVNVITRLSGLDKVAAGEAGTSATVTGQAARIRPGLVALADGSVLIWGGASSGKAEDLGESLSLGGKATKKLTIKGDADLLKKAELLTAGPAVALLKESATEAVLLVSGGMPLTSPSTASTVPTYVAVIDLAKGEATLKPVTIDGKTVYGGLGMAVTRTASGHVALAGGLVALSGAQPCKSSDAECILSQAWLIDGDGADTSAAKPALKSVATLDLGAGQFGVAAAPLPMGALLAGGQSTVFTKPAKDQGALTSTSRVLIAAPADSAAICGK